MRLLVCGMNGMEITPGRDQMCEPLEKNTTPQPYRVMRSTTVMNVQPAQLLTTGAIFDRTKGVLSSNEHGMPRLRVAPSSAAMCVSGGLREGEKEPLPQDRWKSNDPTN